MNRKILSAVAAIVTVLAAVASSSASLLIFYQPKAPKSLSK